MQNQATDVARDLQRFVSEAPPPFVATCVISWKCERLHLIRAMEHSQKSQDHTSQGKDPGERPGATLGKGQKTCQADFPGRGLHPLRGRPIPRN